ncbi:transcriptional regulator family: Fungal Specific TF [Penicillium capsulatum]|uniref:Transcriptional regulator family: Fungal Specific TF n=1 Tax=Penicillium capsulatum TaxID=69766 RepID=A0A9W9IAT8_9EURO|nr:transcriptional regulator family: Fungal Specific TF [Penicillium capsulatum]
MLQSEDEPRKRTSRACDSCYRRKIKCDAAVPQCNWCSHHNLPCTFDRVVHRKRKHDDDEDSRSRPARLSDRIDRIEQLLTQNLMHSHESKSPTPLSQLPDGIPTTAGSPSTSMSSQPIISSMVGVHFAGRELGVISLLTGIPFLLPEGQEWIQARTGQSISSDKLSPTRAPWEKDRGQNAHFLLANLQDPDFFELPDVRCVLVYFEAFRSSPVMRRLFPVVDFDLFEETIASAYKQPKSTFQYGQASIRACIIIFLAFSARLPPVKEQAKGSPFAVLDHDALATKGEFLLGHVLQEPASIEGIQAVTMLALYELTTGNMRLTNYFGAVVARLLFMIGANLTSSRAIQQSERSEKKQKLLRNMFWLCYTIDKDVALRTGQPPTIADENCDLSLPPGYLERAFIDPESELHEGDEPIFPFDLRLSIIKSRAHSALYSVSALHKSDADLLKSIRELDDELEEWRLSVPIHCRPTMSFAPKSSDPNASMHTVMLRLNYYLCMTIIHQASSRCKAWMEGTGMMDGVSSSLALSVEASRSTLCYLEAAEHVLVDGVFWTLIFYPISALLTIFCSILQNPLDPRSRDDMERLSVATQMMNRIFSRKLPANEVVHFKLVSDFVVELKRLAECAIDKAWYEQNAGVVRQ